MPFKKNYLVILLLFVSSFGFTQTYDGMKGYGLYKKYDKTYISPDLRGKNGISLGVIGGAQSSLDGVGFGFHVGYNYLIMKKRRRIVGHKEKLRDEVKYGFGAHFSYLNNGAYYFSLNYLNPFFSLKGKFLSWYFFNEFGLGIHKLPSTEINQKINLNASLEVFRLRFGKSPLHFHITPNYGLANNFLGQDPLEFGVLFGFRYYAFKIK